MVFSSPAFLFYFLPVALLSFWSFGWKVRNLFLLVVSVWFYTSGGGWLITLVLASTLFTYLCGIALSKSDRSMRIKYVRGFAVSTLTLSLLVWKYADFLHQQMDQVSLFHAIIPADPPRLVLPIAISFYTFQCISYLTDVGRGDVEVERSFVRFACYVMFFPQLIAGPIVRYSDVAVQLKSRPKDLWATFSRGAPRFFWGLSKKVLIADQVAVIADATFGSPSYSLTAADVAIGVVAYAVQIYFDFSGYSDMAIGLSCMFGLAFPENFRRPYSANSVTDFWRRWHISLSSWFRDYIYIPLGGNRRGTRSTYRNLLVVFVLTGFWHGANWTFLVWGLVHGCALIVERLGLRNLANSNWIGVFVLRLWMLAVVLLGWLLFRSDDLSHSGELISVLGSTSLTEFSPALASVLTGQRWLWFGVGLLAFVMPSGQSFGEKLSGETPRPVHDLAAVGAGAVALMYALSSSYSPFLYFQF